VGDGVGDSFGVGDGVRDSFGESVGDTGGDSVGDAIGDSVRAPVGDSVGDLVGDAIGDSVGEPEGDSVGGSVGDGVGDSVGESVGSGVDDVLDAMEVVGADVSKVVEFGTGQIGLANGFPMSMKTCTVEDKLSASTPCSFIFMIFSASEKAEFKTTVTMSKIAIVTMPVSLPHIAGVSAGNFPSHLLIHFEWLLGSKPLPQVE
jgi:hypothetical protein